MVTPEGAPPSPWRPAAALIVTALIIFTLAALITAVITAHTLGVIYPSSGFQHANLTPFYQRIEVSPNIIHAFPVIRPGG